MQFMRICTCLFQTGYTNKSKQLYFKTIVSVHLFEMIICKTIIYLIQGKSHFPLSSDRNQWAVVVSRTSISGIDTKSSLYPEWGWLWGIRSSRQINEHSQFVELTFSKSSIWWGGTLELTFHMSICNLSAYMQISTYTMQIFLCGFMHICAYKSA